MRLSYNNSDITSAFKIIKCVHDMYTEKKADTLCVKLYDPSGAWINWKPEAGDEIRCQFNNADTGIMYVNSIVPEGTCITFFASSIRKADMLPRQKSWERVYFKQIVDEIGERNGMAVTYYGVEDKLYGWISQDDVNDYQFLYKLCVDEGCSFVVYNKDLHVFNLDYMYSQKVLVKITAPSNSDFRWIQTDDNVTGVFKDPTKCLDTISAGSVVNLSDSLGRYSGKAFIKHIRFDYVNKSTKVWFKEVT